MKKTQVTYPNWRAGLPRKPTQHQIIQQSEPATDTETQNTSVKRWHFLRYFQSVTMNFVFLLNILCKFCLFVAVFFLL